MKLDRSKQKHLGEDLRKSVCELDHRVKSTRSNPLSENKIHLLRTSIKRLRAIFRLIPFDPNSRQFKLQDHRLRDTGRLLSKHRDHTVLKKTLKECASSRKANEASEHLISTSQAPAVRSSILDKVYGDIHLFSGNLQKAISGKISSKRIRKRLFSSYRRVCKLKKKASRSDSLTLLHRWRKHVKYLMYQLETLHDMLSKKTSKLIKLLHSLEENLGYDHDLRTLETHLLKIGKNSDNLQVVIRKKLKKLRTERIKLSRKIF
jgi:CHAD domain-containing protein